MPTTPTSSPSPHFLRPQANWKKLHFYQKSEVLYQLTYCFTQRFLMRGDRTIDQMVQAARSGKQNIVEGSAAGVTSTETEVKLMNVARASLKELLEDFEDYLKAHHYTRWDSQHPRFIALRDFSRAHNELADYNQLFDRLTDEELCNLGITLCHQTDSLMQNYIKKLEHQFVEQGGIRERMTAARLGRRQTQNETIEAQAHEIDHLRTTITTQQTQIATQQAQIATLQTRITEFEAELQKWHTWWQENKQKFQESKEQQEQQAPHNS